MAKSDAVRITTARSSAADDMRSRQRRYAISMTIRLVCFSDVGHLPLATQTWSGKGWGAPAAR